MRIRQDHELEVLSVISAYAPTGWMSVRRDSGVL